VGSCRLWRGDDHRDLIVLALSPGGGSPARIALATKYVMRAIGDSLVFNTTYLTPPDYWPWALTGPLQRIGCAVGVDNQGHSGDTTAQVLVRARLLPSVSSGGLGLIFAGTNDWNNPGIVQASPTPTATTFTVQSGFGSLFPANTQVRVGGTTSRDQGGTSALVQSVSGDAITLSAPLSGAPSAGQYCFSDTQQNLILTGNAMASLGYTNQVLLTHPYENYSASQGDTLAVPEPVFAQPTRAWQRGACTALGATLADLYTYMRNRIVAGTDIQGSFSWHVADVNVHLNAYGHSIARDCIAAVIPAAWASAYRI
jgi:hypothetical protein